MNLNKSIKEFKSVIPAINQKYRPYAEQVINLFQDRKIEKRKEAEKLLDQLSSRGKGPQSAIKKITEKYSKAESAKGKLTRPTTQTFFVSGVIHTVITYKQKLKKTGTIKERKYNVDTPCALPIKAKNKEEAIEKFIKDAPITGDGSGEDSNMAKTKASAGASVSSAVPMSSFSATTTGSQFMKAVSPIEYSFIPADTSLLKNNGFCVLDQFLGIYSPLIKHMTKEYFIDLCYEVRGEQRPAKKMISALDVGIEDLTDDEGEPDAWNIKNGVSPDMLKKICEREDISHYCFDITRRCFSKSISRNRNRPALIYFCVNNHMYWISNRDEANKLVQQAKDAETKIKSHCIQEDEKKKTNIYTDEDRQIYENIQVSDLMNYD